jgi:hypothetical protein
VKKPKTKTLMKFAIQARSSELDSLISSRLSNRGSEAAVIVYGIWLQSVYSVIPAKFRPVLDCPTPDFTQHTLDKYFPNHTIRTKGQYWKKEGAALGFLEEFFRIHSPMSKDDPYTPVDEYRMQEWCKMNYYFTYSEMLSISGARDELMRIVLERNAFLPCTSFGTNVLYGRVWQIEKAKAPEQNSSLVFRRIAKGDDHTGL